MLVVWSVQVFPFYDLDDATLPLPEDSWNRKVARGVHWFEFSDKSRRFGFAHRSSHIQQNSTQGGNFEFPYPLADAPAIPVYWIFNGEDLVCRVTRLPSPGFVPFGADVPPPSEGSQTLPYTPGTPVVASVSAFGPGGQTWKPDQRREFLANQVEQPRPVGDQGAGTALQLPSGLGEAADIYSYPLVNVQAVLINEKEEIG